MRVQLNGRALAFQAGCVSSILITRSIPILLGRMCVISSAGQSIALLRRGSGVRIPHDTPNIWWVQRSRLERKIVDLEVVGSNPTSHPTNYLSLGCSQAVRQETLTLSRVGSNPATPANLIKALALGDNFTFIGVSPSGKAWDSDSHIRGFETFHPSQN